jgi:hypothetical protein
MRGGETHMFELIEWPGHMTHFVPSWIERADRLLSTMLG